MWSAFAWRAWRRGFGGTGPDTFGRARHLTARMPPSVAHLIVSLVEVYAAIGAAFAAAFVTVGVSRVDANAVGAPWGFRALIFPGAALFWPLLAARWMKARRP